MNAVARQFCAALRGRSQPEASKNGLGWQQITHDYTDPKRKKPTTLCGRWAFLFLRLVGGSGKHASAFAVNDQGLGARLIERGVGHADVGPAVEFFDDLVKWQLGADDRAHHFIGRHAGHADVGGAAFEVLAAVFAAHGIVDPLAAVGAVYGDGSAAANARDAADATDAASADVTADAAV